MTVSETEEIIPLLDHGRRDGGDSNSRCSPSRHSQVQNFSKQTSDDDISSGSEVTCKTINFWDYGTRTPSSLLLPKGTLTENITYSWKNLNVYDRPRLSSWKRKRSILEQTQFPIENRRHILKNVCGVAHPGEFLAIMGSSGAGKTTLLNALTFQSGSSYIVTGTRYLNGTLINDRNTVARLSAYVEQENLFIGTLTVKEHLIFQSLIRIDHNVPYRQKLKRVEDVMTEIMRGKRGGTVKDQVRYVYNALAFNVSTSVLIIGPCGFILSDLFYGHMCRAHIKLFTKYDHFINIIILLKKLGLEKCQNTIIGYPGRSKGISGGEMKRLSFASEVLTNPPMMFCDEPTSGLDSFMALNVINVLKSMAVGGKTVICTIHQPSSEIFSVFDKILLLAEGRTAFLGDPEEAISFFTELGASPPLHYNPADFFIQLLAVAPNREDSCKDTIKLICDSFEQSLHGLKLATPSDQNQVSRGNLSWRSEEPSSYSATWCCQFKALFWRSWINIIKEPMLVKVRLFQTVVLSVVVGLIYHQQKLNENGVMNINGVLFTFLTNMTFQNLFAVITVFSSELPLFLKENSNKLYRVDAYFLSKTLAEIPMFLTIPVIFTAITYYWINLNPKFFHFTFAVLLLMLVTNVATSFGYFLSCISTNVVMALSIGPPVVIPFLLFGGFLLNSGTVPEYFKWLSYFSWFKYGYEALLINQWSDIENIECNTSNVTCPRTGEIVLEIYNFQKANFFWDLTSLLILIIFFRVLAFLALLFRTYSYQRS